MSLSSLQATLELVDGNFKSSMKGVQDSMKTAGETMKEASNQSKGIGGALKDIGSKAGSAIGTVGKLAGTFGLFKAVDATLGMVKNSISGAFDRIDTMDQFNKTMGIMGVSTTDTEKALESLKGVTKGTAYGLDVAAKATQNFVTRGMDIGDATKSVGVWSDAVAVYGKGTNEQLESVTTAIGKMRTKGTVEMDNLNTLFDSGIDAVGMYAKAHGQSSSEVQSALSSGTISAEDFLDTVESGMETGAGGILKIAGAAKDAGGSFSGSFSNMGAAVTRGMVDIITSIDEGLAKVNLPTIKEAIAGFGKFMETTMSGVGEFIAGAFGKIAEVVEYFLPQIESVGQGFVNAFNTVSEIAMPILETVVEYIKNLLGILVEYWTGVFTGENSLGQSFMRMFSAIMEVAVPILQDAISFIQEIIGKLTAFWDENGAAIIEIVKGTFSFIASVVESVMPQIKNTIQIVWGLIKAIISGVLDVLMGLVKVFAGILRGDFSQLWSGIKQITTGVWTVIKGFLQATWNAIKSIASSTWEGIKSAITKPIESAWNFVKKIIDKIKAAFNFKIKFPEIKIPHIKLPHFSLSGEFNPLKGKMPKIGIDWYATGGIFSGPSVIGVGESGDEAVLPLSNKGRMKPFAQAVSSMLDIPEGGGSGDGGNQRITIEVPVSLDRKKIAMAVAPDIEKEIQAIQAKEARKGGRR
ncbi:tape measure protein [Vagococcus salmoninarum]|uniref:tape measure protein n=1 Tax=Vagococcus salmoninarum TaxID=2739 RepID=UPI003F9E7EFE